jgi:hypothetical protein
MSEPVTPAVCVPSVSISPGLTELKAVMGKRKKAITPAQIREEIRKLNLIGKSQIPRMPREAALDLVLRLGIPIVPEAGISPVIKYRLLVGGSRARL